MVHDLGIVESLGLDLMDNLEVNGLSSARVPLAIEG
jgi:hypothetical protein